jgi:hypothetical protein
MTLLEHQKIIDLASPPIRIDGNATLDAAARLSSDSVLTFTATVLRSLAQGIERGLSEERDPRGGAPSNLGPE